MLVAITLSVVKEGKVDEFRSQVASLTENLAASNEAYERAKQASAETAQVNVQLKVTHAELIEQVRELNHELERAKEATLANIPKRIDLDIENYNTRVNEIVVPLISLTRLELLAATPLPATASFKPHKVPNSCQARVEFVNIRPDDMRSIALQFSQHDWWSGWVAKSEYAVHGDVVAVERSGDSTMCLRVSSGEFSALNRLVRRNPDAGIRITILN